MRSGAFLTVAISGFFAAVPAFASDTSCEKQVMPGGSVYYDPFAVFFDLDSAAITPAAARILDNVAMAYRALAHCRLDIAAHADRLGSAKYNLRLSKSRAEAILAYLRRRGLRNEVRIEFFGEERPIVDTEDGVPEPQNRYATIIIAPHDRP